MLVQQRFYLYSMINVLTIVSYPFLPPKMGGQKGIAMFYQFLAPKLNLTCITTTNNDAAEVKSYEVIRLLSSSRLRYINIFYFFSIRKIIHQKKISHLIIEHPYYGWLGLLLQWSTKVKLIIHSHNIESLRFKSTGKWWWKILWHYESFTHRRANCSFFIHDEDRNYAIEKFSLDPTKCFSITYGFELEQAPVASDKATARQTLCSKYGIAADETILLFNGTLDYRPNLDALDIILEKINPLLLADSGYKYRIIICGKKLPARYNELQPYAEKNILYAGFVDDITVFFKGADILLNPVTDGGGIKTKVVEALGYDLTVISTQSGAIGIPENICGGKLKLMADNDWDDFAREIRKVKSDSAIPKAFFNHFYWGNIAEKAAAAIQRCAVKADQ